MSVVPESSGPSSSELLEPESIVLEEEQDGAAPEEVGGKRKASLHFMQDPVKKASVDGQGEVNAAVPLGQAGELYMATRTPGIRTSYAILGVHR